jgi:hypothetical protein
MVKKNSVGRDALKTDMILWCRVTDKRVRDRHVNDGAACQSSNDSSGRGWPHFHPMLSSWPCRSSPDWNMNVDYSLEVSRSISLSTHFEMVCTFKDGALKFDSGNPRWSLDQSLFLLILKWFAHSKMVHSNLTQVIHVDQSSLTI